jgi:mannose-6-phosphate isomerase-like protein (cupin superfamily)
MRWTLQRFLPDSVRLQYDSRIPEERLMHETIRVGRMSVTFLKTTHETLDTLDLFEATLAPGGSSLFPHLHREYDEIVFGMDGIVTWTVDDKEILIGHGDKLSIPRGTPHFYINQQSTIARLMFLHTPGLMGPQYFRDLAACFDSEGTPDLDCIVAVMLRYDVIPLTHKPQCCD